MAKHTNSEYVQRLHKKLLPANIFICLIALIAGICMLVMPWFDMRIQIKGEKLAEFIKEESSSSASLPAGDAAYASAGTMPTASSSSDIDFTEALADALTGVNFNIPVNIYPMKLLKAATGNEADMEALFNSLIGKEGAATFIKDFANTLAPAVLKTTVNIAIEEAMTEAMDGLELTPAQQEQLNTYKEGVADVMDILIDAKTTEDFDDAKAAFGELVERINADQGGESFSDADIDEAFDALIDYGRNPDTGEFDVLTLIQNIDKLQRDAEGESDGIEPASHTVLTAEGEDAEEEVGELQEFIDMLENPGSVVIDKLIDGDAEKLDTIKTISLALFIVMAGIPAFFWFLLALCALLRCLREEKIVKTWYVKLFCIWSGLGVLIGNLAPKLLGKFLGGEVESALSAISVKFLGSGVVAGICWVALLLCGWFYYNRIKKQIKRARRAGR